MRLDYRRLAAEKRLEQLLGFSFTLEQLGDPETVVCVETFVANPFYHMGRALTTDLIDFIGKPKRTAEIKYGVVAEIKHGVVLGDKLPLMPLLPTGVYGFRFITGATGGGKSCSVAAAVSFLYAEFAREREAQVRRIVLIDGGEIAGAPEDALWEGLFQAFVDDADALHELESKPEGKVSAKDAERFVSRRAGDVRVQLTIVVDDGNKIGKGSPGYHLLCSLSCVVVFCASTSSEWLHILRHPKVLERKVVPGAFSDVEFRSYVNIFDFSGVDTSRAGKNPRLLELAKDDPVSLESALKSLENEFRSFLLKASRQAGLLERVRQELCCGGEVPEFFSILLESKCFYRGENRELVAITPHIAAFARASLTQLMDLVDFQKRCTLWPGLTFLVNENP